MMIGEFAGSAGKRYVMLVNLSLERSTHWKIKLKRGCSYETISAVDGKPFVEVASKGKWLTPYGHVGKKPKNECEWLTAGEGVLLRIV